MAFTITAELPLGTYRGASADGRIERIPSVSRLYSSLLCAAGFGPRAVQRADELMGPCEADEVALRWLEENPPDAVSLPAIEINRGRATAYRDDGTIKQSKGAISIKKLAKSPDMSVAVDGAFSWTWSEPPPPDVVASLQALCPDVPYLGTTESPVRLTTRGGAVEATYVLDSNASLFSGVEGEDVELPLEGRLAELLTAHEAVTGTIPSIARDKWKTDEVSRAAVASRHAVALARYIPAAAPLADVPWPEVLLLPLGRHVAERDRVRLAVVAHRALISVIGEGASPLITGIYPDHQPDTVRPANRLAIQVLDAEMPVDLDGAPAALALLVPRGAEPADLDALAAAVAAMPVVYGAGGRPYQVSGRPRALPGAQFWHARPPGMLRLWRTTPPAVPDTRGVKGHPWTFAHAALLSLGFVWKDQLPKVEGRGDERQRAFVDVVNGTGAAVVRTIPLRETDVRPFVHKVNLHAVIRPYRAELWLGDLCGERTIQALGQTRHLGGGLLVPVDVAQAAGER